MKPLSPSDQLFLILEGRSQPMHVGSMILLEPPADAGPDYFANQVQKALKANKPQPPFNQLLVRRMGMWFWDEDKEFDIEAHVHHIALPKPGRIRELLAIVSKLHSALMDRAKPLWEVYFIEGVEGGRAALYFKIHHSVVDGVAGARMLQKAMSDDPDDRDLIPVWAMPPKERELDNDGAKDPLSILSEVGGLVREQMTAIPKVAREVMRSFRRNHRDPDDVYPFQAPESILNQRISASRRFAAQDWELTRIKHVAHQCDATLNDVVMAMCASALRRYLLDLNALPEKPLIAMVPVSLRKDDSQTGNQVAMVLSTLATNEPNPFARLQAIKRSMHFSKERLSRMSQLEIIEYVSAVMSFAGINIATGLAPKKQSFNVIISNVPGPKKTLYFNGAKIVGAYPVSIVVDGQALNITLNSYADKLEFGLIACSRTLPSMQRLLQYLEDGLRELEGDAETRPIPAPKKKPKKASSSKKSSAKKAG